MRGRASCSTLHPFLRHYLGRPGTRARRRTSGDWNSFTGSTGGWQQVAVRPVGRSPAAQVEVSISYVTDPFTGGVGAFVDDTRLVVDGVTTAGRFEGATSAWARRRRPRAARTAALGHRRAAPLAATATRDTILLGFGLEQLATDQDRATLVRRALRGLNR